jgi:catechol 2,3-dioxygenase
MTWPEERSEIDLYVIVRSSETTRGNHMGASTNEMFGTGDGVPATPGSYGEPPRGYRLPAATQVGHVKLQVADLVRSIDYYDQVIGLRVVDRQNGAAKLAPREGDRILVELNERRGANPATRRAHLGLFHFAILLPDRASLGRFVRHLAEIGERAGAGDHLVSEAFYLTDPDGLGIEVYADRPRESWKRSGRELMMATDPVDVADVVRAAGDVPWNGLPAATVMGHVHLHVGDIDQADDFYAEGVGFDRIVRRYPGALFLSAGGYHHHLGTNIWAGGAAKPPAENDAQLLEWTLSVPTQADVESVAANLARRWPVNRDSGDVVTADPWGTTLRILRGDRVT